LADVKGSRITSYRTPFIFHFTFAFLNGVLLAKVQSVYNNWRESSRSIERGKMMNEEKLREITERFLAAWNAQDVEAVLGCYTDDLVYRDPNTRGEIRGADAMRSYLETLFSRWIMTWEPRSIFTLSNKEGVAALWHASFRRPNGTATVEADGMDLILIQGDRISRNEVYFDRTVLASLLE
jgi:ketosteroid isomerase-like protein